MPTIWGGKRGNEDSDRQKLRKVTRSVDTKGKRELETYVPWNAQVLLYFSDSEPLYFQRGASFFKTGNYR
jgi:hypothetical protein